MIGDIRNITGPARAALAAFALLLGRRADSAGQGFDSCVHGRCGAPSSQECWGSEPICFRCEEQDDRGREVYLSKDLHHLAQAT